MAVFLSRLPFVSQGLGLDGDSWFLSVTAKKIYDTGEYSVSRFPGYPVHEYLCALFVRYGDVALNLISAVFSAVAAGFFALILRRLRFKRIWLASVAFAMVPSFFIYSTTAIDYVPALAFILGSMYFLLGNRLITAGIFLGLAIGCRITSGAMLLPFAIMIFEIGRFRQNIRKISLLVFSTIIVGMLVYIPVIKTYGLDFFTYSDVPYPSIARVLYKFFIETWGFIGLIAIVAATGMLFLPDKVTARRYLFPRSVNEKFIIAWLIAIDLYIIAFLKLPMESGYLMPVIPFVIFIFGRYLYSRAFEIFCCLLILSSVFCTIGPADRNDSATPSSLTFHFNAGGEELMFDVLRGPVPAFDTRRRNANRFVDQLIKSVDTVSSPSVLVAGRWYYQLLAVSGDSVLQNLRLISYLAENEALNYYAKDFKIYYLPGQDHYNKQIKKVDLSVYDAIPYVK